MNKLGKIFILLGILLVVISFGIYNFYNYRSIDAQKAASDILNIIKDEKIEPVVHEENDLMDTIMIDGYDYIGILTIPSLNLELPVMSDYDYKRLKKAPCRYHGSLFTNDLVICAHSYKSHFGKIKRLKQKDKIIFTDMNRDNYMFEVLEIEILNSTDIDKMINSEYDLTLYTCTSDGSQRIAVRCNRVM